MKIVCRYTIDDYAEAHRLHRKGSIWRQWDRFVGWLFFLLCAGAGLLIVASNPHPYRIALPSLGLAVFWALLLFVFPGLRMRYIFKRSPYFNQESSFDISEDGILNENPNMRSQRNWNLFTRWAENGRLFMIYSSPVQFVLLPKRSFAAGDIEQLRELLRRKIPVR